MSVSHRTSCLPLSNSKLDTGERGETATAQEHERDIHPGGGHGMRSGQRTSGYCSRSRARHVELGAPQCGASSQKLPFRGSHGPYGRISERRMVAWSMRKPNSAAPRNFLRFPVCQRKHRVLRCAASARSLSPETPRSRVCRFRRTQSRRLRKDVSGLLQFEPEESDGRNDPRRYEREDLWQVLRMRGCCRRRDERG